MKPNKADHLAGDFQATFGTPQGQRVLWTIAGWAHLFQTSYHPRQSQEATAFREGERNIMLRILAMMRWKEEEIIQRLDDLQRPEEAVV